jgi:hypothetical protein
MARISTSAAPENPFASRTMFWWKLVQAAVWFVGLFIVFSLLFFPKLGIILMWNVLIPVAPLLLVVCGGIWRNICPLATTALLPRRFGFSQKRKLTPEMQACLGLAGIVALYVIVPLRHAFFNMDGPGTALLLMGISAVAFGMGARYEWKSGWCNSLCPVHPVERLYSSKVGLTVPNANCGNCMKCVAPCPDSTPGIHPLSVRKMQCQRIGGYMMVGGFPGFIWGWFQVPDQHGLGSWSSLFDIYFLPFASATCTLGLYILLERLVSKKQETRLISLFAAASVSCYYWFRLPALLGFSRFGTDGLLVNLRDTLPAWSVTGITTGMVLFFFWWLVWRKPGKHSWTVRPAYG